MHKHLYNIGDKVKIKSYEWFKNNADKYGVIYNVNGEGADMNLEMAKYCGQILTIEEDFEASYKMKENKYVWTDSMIEGIVDETQTIDELPIWTIQDAKDGDVIFYDDGWTCIFKSIHGIWFSSYCFITCDGEFHTGYEEHAVDSTINGNAHPATKEQCNILFQKIKEAGYKWNPETKTLE